MRYIEGISGEADESTFHTTPFCIITSFFVMRNSDPEIGILNIFS